jgi:hypothetical protein
LPFEGDDEPFLDPDASTVDELVQDAIVADSDDILAEVTLAKTSRKSSD